MKDFADFAAQCLFRETQTIKRRHKMIYRFTAKLIGSGETIEVQIQAPPDTPIDEMCESLRSSISEKGVEIDSLRYIGSPEPGVDGIFVAIHWYEPAASEPANNTCLVEACGQESTFHLCKKHALPGIVKETANQKFVVSAWLVEREGRKSLITITDYDLGDLFDGREAFERWLHEEGYKIDHLIPDLLDLQHVMGENPAAQIVNWRP